jgi:hypothetical protein
MDPYLSEHLMQERHAAFLREAELLARLVPARSERVGLNSWFAWRLRGLADRLDGQGRFEKAAQ